MNLINILFRKKEQTPPEIGFDELPEWLESRSKKLSEELGRHAISVYSDIENALTEIKESISSLEKASPHGRFHLKMVKISVSNRDNMVKQVRTLIENIAIPKTTDVRVIMDFHKSAMQSLTVCLENIMKSYQYTKLVFLEESKQVIADVNMLGRFLNQLIEPVKDKIDLLGEFENASRTTQAIKDTRSAVEIENSSINEKEEKAVSLKNEIEDLQKSLSHLKDGQAWEQYLRCKDELAVFENSAKKAESEINDLVLHLGNAFNRLKQLNESGRYTLQPHVKEGLYLCLSDPKSVTPEFFAEFRSIAESNALDIAPEKRDKILEQLRFVTSSFGPLKEQYQALILDIEKKKDELSKHSINQEIVDLTSRITGLQNELESSEKDLEVSGKRLASVKQNIELKKQELQQIISAIDNRIKILF